VGDYFRNFDSANPCIRKSSRYKIGAKVSCERPQFRFDLFDLVSADYSEDTVLNYLFPHIEVRKPAQRVREITFLARIRTVNSSLSNHVHSAPPLLD